MKKRSVFLITIGLCLALTGIGIWGIRKAQQTRFNELFRVQNLAIIEDTPIDAIGHLVSNPTETQVHIFTQKDDKTAISQYIKTEVEQTRIKKQNLLFQEWVIVYPQTLPSNLKNVTAYEVVSQTYRTKGLEVYLAKEKRPETFYATEAGQEITLHDLIADKKQFQQTLASILPATSEPEALAAHELLLQEFEQGDWSNINFRIEEDTLLLDKATISLSVFVDSLNTDYFSEETLTVFRSNEKALQEMQSSDETVTFYYDN
ncbi:hypothetical protein ACVR1I_00140 [Streptococcus cameli]